MIITMIAVTGVVVTENRFMSKLSYSHATRLRLQILIKSASLLTSTALSRYLRRRPRVESARLKCECAFVTAWWVARGNSTVMILSTTITSGLCAEDVVIDGQAREGAGSQSTRKPARSHVVSCHLLPRQQRLFCVAEIAVSRRIQPAWYKPAFILFA